MSGSQRAVTCTKELGEAEYTDAFTISKPPGSAALKWNKTSMLPTLFSHIYGLLLPRVKAVRFLGCIYISLLRTRRFDKELAPRARVSASRTKTGTYTGMKFKSRIGNAAIKTKLSRFNGIIDGEKIFLFFSQTHCDFLIKRQVTARLPLTVYYAFYFYIRTFWNTFLSHFGKVFEFKVSDTYK